MPTRNRILTNLSLANMSVSSVKEGVQKLQNKKLEVIYIILEPVDSKTFRKKEYFDIHKQEIPCKLDEWIHENMIEDIEYRRLLDKYIPLKEKLKIDDVDNYILEKHYRKQALGIVQKRVKNFKLDEWLKKRHKLRYTRKTNLILQNGSSFRFDFRNFLETLFILKENNEKKILAVGGSGGSGQRHNYSLYTAIFYLLSKSGRIPYHLLRYTGFNRFKYIKTFFRPIITFDLGSNYHLEDKLKDEIRAGGIDFSCLMRNNRAG